MADETRMTHQPAANLDADLKAGMDRETLPTPDRGAAPTGPNPNVARAQIEQTRARMSETIDEIEDVLVRKKEEIQSRLDILAPVRERPLPSLGLVFGAGVLLGLITGGDDDDDRVRDRDRLSDHELEARAELWEQRARRLLRIARQQEQELEALSSGTAQLASIHWDDEAGEALAADSEPTAWDKLRDEIADGVTGFLTESLRGVFGSARG